MDEQPTRPSSETRDAEREQAQTQAHADREPTPEEEEQAEARPLSPDVVEHEREMIDRGVNQKGEGRI